MQQSMKEAVETKGLLSAAINKVGNVVHSAVMGMQGAVEIPNADAYVQALADNFVMVDQDARRELIRQQVTELAAAEGGIAEIDEDLLEEVNYLVEYPTALCGKFEEKFLSLPKEAIITPMREHQRYFPVVDEEGRRSINLLQSAMAVKSFWMLSHTVMNVFYALVSVMLNSSSMKTAN